jgi:hypothetical protein
MLSTIIVHYSHYFVVASGLPCPTSASLSVHIFGGCKVPRAVQQQGIRARRHPGLSLGKAAQEMRLQRYHQSKRVSSCTYRPPRYGAFLRSYMASIGITRAVSRISGYVTILTCLKLCSSIPMLPRRTCDNKLSKADRNTWSATESKTID